LLQNGRLQFFATIEYGRIGHTIAVEFFMRHLLIVAAGALLLPSSGTGARCIGQASNLLNDAMQPILFEE
jgi:hypothetical protein